MSFRRPGRTFKQLSIVSSLSLLRDPNFARPLLSSVLKRHIHQTPNRVIFSGIQPTGVPHIGNYLGALQQWVRLQNEELATTKLVFSIVDLHAITIQQDAAQLKRWKRECLAALLAVGLDPERCIIFYQSDVRMKSIQSKLEVQLC